MKTLLLCCVVLVENSCLGAISDSAFLYTINLEGDVRIRPTNAAITEYPDLSASAGGVELRYRYDNMQGVISGFPPTADLGIDAYLVQPGDAFSRAAIVAGKFPVIIQGSNWGQQLLVGEDFFVGLSVGVPAGIPRQHFGWTHLKRLNGEIAVVDQTWALKSDGIIVGTRTAVPESSTIILLVTALGSLACRWRSKPRTALRASRCTILREA